MTPPTQPPTKHDADAASRWERALLEELIYERVRLNVDLLELADFERELAASIEQALAACGAREDRDRLAREHLDRAWTRLERDWSTAREAPDDPLQCPLCGDLTGA
jgi:thioesterase domain-containing protein